VSATTTEGRIIVRAFFKDDDFNFLTEIALGAVYHRAADVGEVLTTVERIHNGRPQTWDPPAGVRPDLFTSRHAG